MARNIALLFFSLFPLTVIFGQSKQDKQTVKLIDELISKRLDKISPGCAVLISKNGQILYNKAFGIADIELNVPTQPNMVFRIGSITKQFTAVAILQLVEQGKLSLKDSLQKFVTDFPSKGHTITIENLLTQTSGIPDYLNLEFNISNPFRIDFTPKQIIDSLKNQSLEFIPSSRFAYSNSNYFLLGYIIEKVSGKKYQEYLSQNIFTPLGLTNTYYDNPTQIIPNRVKGYEKIDKKYYNADFISMSGFYSAGGLMSNTEDLYKWNSAINSYTLLKKETLDKAFQPYKLTDGKLSKYGYGWFIRNLDGSKTIEHGGSIFGFRSEEIYLPNENIFIAGLFNCRQLNNDEQELSYDLARIMLRKPLVKDIQLADSILDSYVGTYQLTDNPNRTIVITKEKDFLLANAVGQGSLPIMFQSETKFILKGVDAKCEFIKENGQTTKIFIQQNGEFIWKKIK
ncbi:MAG TPA: serine hydrolase domain-containing protein [Parafilimonas sp.]|nr:serine hydrolase domain-containing protein [Parafilimonas sp.]